jgi:hypothetical protein
MSKYIFTMFYDKFHTYDSNIPTSEVSANT